MEKRIVLGSGKLYVVAYTETMPEDATIDRYIVGIAFNDGSQINCTFMDKQMAVDFLQRNAMYS